MIDNLRKRYEQLQGLLNTPMNQGGGLLGNIPQGALLGSAIFGQGIQGKDPFSALLPAVSQTAQLQQFLTPKEKERKIITGADGFQYYADTGERVLPGVKKPANEIKKPFEAKNVQTGQNVFITPDMYASNPELYQPIEKSPLVTMDKGETKYEEVRGKQEADKFGNIQSKAIQAQENLTQFDLIDNLSQNIDTGFAGDLLLDVAKFGKRMNINTDWITNPNGTLKSGIPAAESLQVLGVQIALDKIQKTKGSISDTEFKTFLNTSPALSMSPEGITVLNNINRGLARRDIEVAGLAAEWENNYGKLNNTAETPYGKKQTFDQFINSWKEDPINKLFNDEFYKNLENTSNKNQSELNETTTEVNGIRYKVITFGDGQKLVLKF